VKRNYLSRIRCNPLLFPFFFLIFFFVFFFVFRFFFHFFFEMKKRTYSVSGCGNVNAEVVTFFLKTSPTYTFNL